MYTDGACKGNPGPGGYGTIIEFKGETTGTIHKREYHGGYKHTTNSRMELMAVIIGLEQLIQPCNITLYSDSKYVIDALSKGWLDSWVKKNWTRGKNQPVANVDLWKRILAAMSQHELTYVWVKGHAGNPGNERCDELANQAITDGNLQDDVTNDLN